MTVTTDAIAAKIVENYRKPLMLFAPEDILPFQVELDPANKQPIFVDLNPADAFHPDFDYVKALADGCTKVYYSAGEDVSWVPVGFTKIAITIKACNGTGATTSSVDNSLTDLTQDFVAAGITAAHRCFIKTTSGTVGVYTISTVTATKLTFSTNPGNSVGNVVYGAYSSDGGNYEVVNNGTDTAYVFWPSSDYPIDPVSGYAYRNLRLSHTSPAGANLPTRDVLIIPHNTDIHDREFGVNGALVLRLIGGSFKASLPPQVYTGYAGPTTGGGNANGLSAVLAFSDIKTGVFAEGFIADANNKFGMDILRPAAVVTLSPEPRPSYIVQNYILKNAHSDADTGLHADCFQPNGPVGWVIMYHGRMDSDYQALFLAQQGRVYQYILMDLQCRYPDPDVRNGYLFFLITSQTEAFTANNSGIMPVLMNKVYVSECTSLGWEDYVVWPRSVDALLPGVLAADGRSFSWSDAVPSFVGSILKGDPPSGPIVLEADVGPGYEPTGYMDPAPFAVYIPDTYPYITASGLNLTATPPVYKGGAGTSTYQWYKAADTANIYGAKILPTLIPGATSSTYTGVVGTRYFCQITHTNPVGTYTIPTNSIKL